MLAELTIIEYLNHKKHKDTTPKMQKKVRN